MNLKIEGPLTNQSTICGPILRSLPDWFGIEKAILGYECEIDRLPTFLAKDDGIVLGFISLKQHFPASAEIYVMGVLPEAHRLGIGRALVTAAEAHARRLGIEYLQVKTLGPTNQDPGYARTRVFYNAMGFVPMEEFKKIWDENNPCLILVKRL